MTTKEHPSNILYRDEVTDFAFAMRLVDDMLRHERRLGYGDPEDGDAAATYIAGLEAMMSAAARCAAEHAEAVRAAELVLAAKWAEHQDGYVRAIGKALESGDYSALAI